jgi:hypothetical protein
MSDSIHTSTKYNSYSRKAIISSRGLETPRGDFQLALDRLGDPETLASRLDNELNVNKSFASFVGLVGASARKRPIPDAPN